MIEDIERTRRHAEDDEHSPSIEEVHSPECAPDSMITHGEQAEWYSLDDVDRIDSTDDGLYCLKVDSPRSEFLVGQTLIPTHNTEEAKAQQALKGEAASIIGSVARLGRAAGVFLMIATQRPDAKLIPGELKSNLGCRLACGNMASTASSMVLENGDATRTPGYPKGRGIVKVYSNQERCQFYFAPQEWIVDWLKRRGLNPDGTPLESGPSGILADDNMDLIRNGETMNSLQGVDNEGYIDELREQDAQVKAAHAAKLAEMGIGVDARARLQADAARNTASSGPVPGSVGYEEAVKLGHPDLKGSSGEQTGRPEDEWADYGGVMDALKAAGDDDDDPAPGADSHEGDGELLMEEEQDD